MIVKRGNKPIKKSINMKNQSTIIQKLTFLLILQAKIQRKILLRMVLYTIQNPIMVQKRFTISLKNTNLMSHAKHVSYEKVFIKENLEKIKKYIMENIKYPYIARKMG